MGVLLALTRSPVLLGITVLRERVSPWQSVGLVAAGAVVGLLAAG